MFVTQLNNIVHTACINHYQYEIYEDECSYESIEKIIEENEQINMNKQKNDKKVVHAKNKVNNNNSKRVIFGKQRWRFKKEKDLQNFVDEDMNYYQDSVEEFFDTKDLSLMKNNFFIKRELTMEKEHFIVLVPLQSKNTGVHLLYKTYGNQENLSECENIVKEKINWKGKLESLVSFNVRKITIKENVILEYIENKETNFEYYSFYNFFKNNEKISKISTIINNIDVEFVVCRNKILQWIHEKKRKEYDTIKKLLKIKNFENVNSQFGIKKIFKWGTFPNPILDEDSINFIGSNK